MYHVKQRTCFRDLFVLMSSATVFDSEVSFFWSCSVSFFSFEELCWSVARDVSSVNFSCSCTQEKKGEEGEGGERGGGERGGREEGEEEKEEGERSERGERIGGREEGKGEEEEEYRRKRGNNDKHEINEI